MTFITSRLDGAASLATSALRDSPPSRMVKARDGVEGALETAPEARAGRIPDCRQHRRCETLPPTAR